MKRLIYDHSPADVANTSVWTTLLRPRSMLGCASHGASSAALHRSINRYRSFCYRATTQIGRRALSKVGPPPGHGHVSAQSRVCASSIRHFASSPGSKPSKTGSLLSDEDYTYHLTRPLPKTRTYRPTHYLDTIDSAVCKARMPLQLRDDPLKVFGDPETSIETASAALDLFAKQSCGSIATQAARDAYSKERPGQSALLWLLNNKKLGDTDVRTACSFAGSMTHALAAESPDGYLRDWVMAHQPIRDSEETVHHHNRRSVFGSFKIRGAMAALCYWTTKQDLFADAFALFRLCVENLSAATTFHSERRRNSCGPGFRR